MPVRLAEPRDVNMIRRMLKEHAAAEMGGFHRTVSDEPVTDELDAVLGGDNPSAFVTLVFLDEAPEDIAGLAFWYPTFSSWSLAGGIWLEDLFVEDSYRNAGLGRELMMDLRSRTTGRIEWDVADGNEGAMRFYRKLGASPDRGWTKYRWLPYV